ncbi:MAG: mechanosensitive ion channel family protein [Verrucomicrobiales bacterium]
MACLGFSLWAADPQPTSTNATTQATVEINAPNAKATIKVEEKSPNLTFGLDRVEVLNRQVLGSPLWQYIASLLFIFLAFMAAKIVDWIVSTQLRRLVARTSSELDDKFLQYVHGPIKLIVFVLLLQVGLEVFEWPAWIEVWMKKGFFVILALSITYMLVRMVDLLVLRWKSKAAARTEKSFNDQLFPIISKSLKVFIVVVAALLTSQNLGLNITSLIASLSVVGLALGLAAQDTAANLFGAVAVFVDKPFQIGDRIKLDAVDGTVESIGLRSTRVRNLDGHLITVPNKTMGTATITNITRRPNIKTVMTIGITYDTKTEKVKRAVEILKDVYKGHPKTHDLVVGFNQFGESSLNIQVIHWWGALDYKEYVAGMEQMNLTIKDRFDAEGISFAFPSRTLYLKQDSDFRFEAKASEPKLLQS